MSQHDSRGITAPLGFRAAGMHCGIKKPGLLDLALVVSEVSGPIAGVFTTNQVVAAPVTLDRLSIGNITERSVPALIAQPGQLRTNLLGMSFLNRLDSWEVRGDKLRMRGTP